MKKSITIAIAVLALFAISACSDVARNALTGPSAVTADSGASAEAEARALHGTAVVQQMPGVVYRNTIQARLNAAGEASGSVTVNLLDLSGLGEGFEGKATLILGINCLEFSGDSVWFGAELVSSSRKELLANPALAQSIGQVKIANGQTYLFSGPALFYTPPGTTCKDRPVLPIAPITEGHFQIK